MTDRSDKKAQAEEAVNERTAEAERKASENLDLAKRIQADFDNYRKRSQKENEEFRRYASESLISDLLVIVDDLERALSHAPKDNDLTIGVNAIKGNLMRTLSSKGLTEISTDGRFDPSIHEALCAEPGDNDGEITEVFQKGYRIGDRVLRYAKVKVTRKQTEGEQKCQE
ncbi:MAG: nucleotide exchange factor GrpE [Methanomassiliicoccaceae archaeon]|jgi:molecular chaperone GrpE|nr:nucleotide exchange factor GrpE [Methanomassiliicoccaceae archaeon]